MKKEELLKYEMPSIAEYISIAWMQKIVARYCAWKINRKWRRYENRQKREKFLKGFMR